MPTQEQQNTQTAVIGTEHTLGSAITTAKTLILVVDTVNMVNGDILELRVKTKTLTGSTVRQAYKATYRDVQIDKNKYSIPIPSMHSWEASLKQTAGTGRNFDWAYVSL